MTQTQNLVLAQRKQQGFILVLTLWVLVIVSIAAAYFSERVTLSVELAQQSRQNTAAMIDIDGTRAEILYRLATTYMSAKGVGQANGVIELDNRPYRGMGNTQIRLQDNRGLLNLNIPEDDRILRLLGILGIASDQRGRMIDTLRDYTDIDNLHRLNGAEKEEYLALNLPPPSNKNLVTSWEAQRIIGWRDVPQLWQNGRLAELTSADTSFGINVNTAPPEILATLPGISEEIAQIIVAKRKLMPLVRVEQLTEIPSIAAQQLADSIGILPSNSIRITQSTQGLPWAIQYNITLTPNSNEGPWRVDYYSRVSLNRLNESQANISKLPLRDTAMTEILAE